MALNCVSICNLANEKLKQLTSSVKFPTSPNEGFNLLSPSSVTCSTNKKHLNPPSPDKGDKGLKG